MYYYVFVFAGQQATRSKKFGKINRKSVSSEKETSKTNQIKVIALENSQGKDIPDDLQFFENKKLPYTCLKKDIRDSVGRMLYKELQLGPILITN